MGAATARVSESRYEETLLGLGRQVARVKETERLKMAEHLHDEFGQGLLVAKMRLGLLSDELPEQYVGSVNGITTIINDLIRRTRATIQDLYSMPLCPGGFKTALGQLAKDMKIKHGIACSADLDFIPEHLSDQVQEALYRAVRELLFNVAKHARASRVKINVSRRNSWIVIDVKDNGRGFSSRKAPLFDGSGGFGLLSVRADLSAIGAELHILSRIGKGTRATITVPLDLA